MSKRDYYEVLGVSKTASQDEIKKAYRTLSKKNHPDVGGDEEAFKEINEANEILSNPEKRANYDAYGHEGKRGFDMFRGFDGFGDFNSHYQRVRMGNNISVRIYVTLEEVFKPVKRTYKYNRHKSCSLCNSKGGTDLKTCSNCGGNGIKISGVNTPFGYMSQQEICTVCSGTGTIPNVPCKECNGSGVILTEDSIDILFPAGIYDGMSISVEGKGNAIKDGSEGSLIIYVSVLPHKNFIRNDNNLLYKLKLTYPQFVLGDKIEVPTIDGNTIKITIPEFSKVNDRLRIKNKGLKVMSSETRGDMFIILDISMPESISKEEKKLIEDLKNLNNIS